MQSTFIRQRQARFFLQFALAMLLATQIGFPPALAAGDVVFANDPVQLGRELFEHKWLPHDSLCSEGDGLGPLYNSDSCASCHHLGGPGGAGIARFNVELLTVMSADGKPFANVQSGVFSRFRKFHPGFSGLTPTVLLHRFGTDRTYERWRLLALGFELPASADSTLADVTRRAFQRKETALPIVADLPRRSGREMRLTRRNTTPLFGLGLLDAIPEKTLVSLANEQAEKSPGITGRVARTADGKVGRFGWRGQVATLNEFVVTACAMELGLQNPRHPQARDPRDREFRSSRDDLTVEQCKALVAFVASLAAPLPLPPKDARQALQFERGEKHFQSIGCAACHVRDLADVRGVFSDLLLHDLGRGLEDRVPAAPEPSRRDRAGRSPGGLQVRCGVQESTLSDAEGDSPFMPFTSIGSYGGGLSTPDVPPEVLLVLRREWKTPPLWGVRQSAPYLHDGRARTIAEAIAAHGGEAESSAIRFKDLDRKGRDDLLAFLASL